MITESLFKPAWWLANPHAQTVFSTLTHKGKAAVDHIERIELPDGDFVDLAWSIHGLEAHAPLVILLHGLGGGLQSPYVSHLFQVCNQHGWRAVLMLFRGASSEPNRYPRAYHSGDTQDLDYIVKILCDREPNTKKAIVGISLGGNVLLKWLGEQEKQPYIQTGVAISVPFQLRLAADRMNQGLSRFYQTYLLRELRWILNRKIQLYKNEMPPGVQNIDSFDCFWTFDEFVTAPLHGFPNVHAYYREASSRQYLEKIHTPTLIIHALDDPFMTPEVIPNSEELSSDVILELSKKGGHVGFISGNIPGVPEFWLDQRIPEHLKDFL
ncbi:hydrolase [Legionella yabuuchiae]|uniref:hydrolase n=1 Tax=Legionella yabuuchiae TaxID=376727 RepID=UPI0010564E24|nr:hydrolase [Legionella yabuuchiae]